jgi:hypothetical protein
LTPSISSKVDSDGFPRVLRGGIHRRGHNAGRRPAEQGGRGTAAPRDGRTADQARFADPATLCAVGVGVIQTAAALAAATALLLGRPAAQR